MMSGAGSGGSDGGDGGGLLSAELKPSVKM